MAALGVTRTFQSIRLFGDLTVLDNVHGRLPPPAAGGLLSPTSCADARAPSTRRPPSAAKAMALLEFVGIADRAHELAQNLSYGQQRLLEIARALAVRPALLLLDEPAAGVNPTEIHHLSKIIRDIQRGRRDPGRHRAPHGAHHGDLRRRLRPRLRREDRRGHDAGRSSATRRSSRPTWARPAEARPCLASVASGSTTATSRRCAGVDLEAREGEITAIIGSNGAGKTSTLMAISGLAPVTGGEILFRGRSITRVAAARDHRARHHPDPGGPPALRRPDRRGQPPPRRLLAPRGGRDRVRPAHGARDGPLPHPAPAAPAARRHPVGRRAADAGHRAGPHVRATRPPDGRAVHGAGPAPGPGDRAHHPGAQGRRRHHPPRRADGLGRPPAGRPRLRARERARHARRHRSRARRRPTR